MPAGVGVAGACRGWRCLTSVAAAAEHCHATFPTGSRQRVLPRQLLHLAGGVPLTHCAGLLPAGCRGKRTATNDFAGVVHRMKLLGFTSIRLPFKFDYLMQPIPGSKSEFTACMRDDPTYVATKIVKDPECITTATPPAYTGMPHPPPCVGVSDPAVCSLPWEAPFRAGYTPHANSGQIGGLKLSQCNWYLPSAWNGANVLGIHR